MESAQTVHSDDLKCKFCGQGHSEEDCDQNQKHYLKDLLPKLDMTSNKNTSMGNTSRSKKTLTSREKKELLNKRLAQVQKEKARQFERNRLKNMDPALLADMLERKKS